VLIAQLCDDIRSLLTEHAIRVELTDGWLILHAPLRRRTISLSQIRGIRRKKWTHCILRTEAGEDLDIDGGGPGFLDFLQALHAQAPQLEISSSRLWR
jgi:hypothetical protein